MNTPSFRRKVLYLALIAALLYPLSQLSQPSTIGAAGQPGNPGGKLAELRNEYRLGQANLGKIDPSSETLKLATFGMRGIATTMLWNRADEYNRRKDWTGFQTVLEQIKSLQPYYIGVWQFQAHNLSYNISADWDDYHDRYYWVRRGIEMLQEGCDYNREDPRLYCDVAFFATHKIGQSDERVQFRRLFREDDEFHAKQQVHVPNNDNWLFGAEYYQLAQSIVDNAERLGESVLLPVGPLMFYVRPVLSRTLWCDALEEDHRQELIAAWSKENVDPKDRARQLADIDRRYSAKIADAWKQAQQLWLDYGQRAFIGAGGVEYRLADFKTKRDARDAAIARLESLAPGVRERLRRENIDKLDPEHRRAFDLTDAERSMEQRKLAFEANQEVFVGHRDVADAAPENVRAEAQQAADEALRLEPEVFEIENSLSIPNYDYWLTRCAMEQTEDARQARRLVHHARTAFEVDADLVASRQSFEQAFAHWRKIVDRYPEMLTDQTGFLMLDAIGVYRQVLQQLDEPFPKNFVLQNLIDAHDWAK